MKLLLLAFLATYLVADVTAQFWGGPPMFSPFMHHFGGFGGHPFGHGGFGGHPFGHGGWGGGRGGGFGGGRGGGFGGSPWGGFGGGPGGGWGGNGKLF